ncbi:MAG: nuclear transport factor 2 family protein [Crocinitomicaceae bacterium]|nr:nuclear transport factor 2 family protein [Flavobacteriales bacterium]NQZ36783.1 nuclear transport factor 2 family protein [Crocinitomicaceae bacterium]
MRIILTLFCLGFILISAKPNPISNLNAIVDDWHLAATNADYDGYFGRMNEEFIFLGTAPGERWSKDEFSAFSKPYFDKGKAWDFKASNRQWNFSKNGKIAWFDEDLDTWMRGCRGSGILVKKKGKWMIAYYNLTVLIENEKIDSFIELRDEPIEEE